MLVVVLAGLLVLSYLIRPVFVAFASLFGGVLMAILLGGAVGWVERRLRVPRSAALAITWVTLSLSVAGLLWSIGAPLIGQAVELTARFPETVQSVREALHASDWGRNLISIVPDAERIGEFGPRIVGGISRAFSSTLEGLLSGFVALFIAIYLVLEPERYLNGTLKLVPRERRGRAREIVSAITNALRWWLIGRLAAMAIVGALSIVSLLLLGVPFALGLGSLAGLLSFLPYLGPILAAIPAVLVAVSQAPILAVYVAVVYGGIQLIENYLVTPLVQRRLVRLAPVVAIVVQVVMGLVFGLAGAFLATPLAIVAIVILQMIYIEDRLGEQVTILGSRRRP